MKNIILSVLFVVVLGLSVNADTVIVTGDTSAGENQPGWLFNRDTTTATQFQFDTNKASIGFGSLHVLPIGMNPSDKFIGEYFLNTPIADVDSISYDFQLGIGGPGNSYQQFYMNVYAVFGDSDPLKFYDCRYDIIPASGSTASFTTATFDPTQAYPVTQRTTSRYPCPAKPADMDMSHSGSRIRMFSISVGDTSASDAGVSGYYDKVVVSTSTGATTFDFEPVLTPTTADQCKKGGWMNFNTPTFSNQGSCVSFVVSSSPNH